MHPVSAVPPRPGAAAFIALAAGVVLAALVALPGLCLAVGQAAPSAPRAGELVLFYAGDRPAQVDALLEGRADVLPLPDPEGDLEALAALAADSRVDVLAAPGFRLFHLGFNTRGRPFSDRAFRHALAHGVDRQGAAEAAFGPYAFPASGYVPEYDPLFAPVREPIPFDPDRAAALLDEAGYTRTREGVRRDPRTGQPLAPLTLLAPTEEEAPPAYRAARVIADGLQALGIPITLEALPWPVLRERIARTDFDAYALSWWIPRNSADYLHAVFHSSQDVLGGLNTTGISRNDLDRALEALQSAPNLEAARQSARTVQGIVQWEVPFVPLFYVPVLTAVRTDRVDGLTPMPRYGAADHRHRWGVLTMGLAGDGDHPADEPVRWIIPAPVRSLDPFTAVGPGDWDVLGLLYEPLWTLDPVALEPIPWLASRWNVEVGEDGTTRITFWLRDDVRWHDGRPLTSSDVQFTFERARANELAAWAGDLRQLTGVEAPDPHQVVLTFATGSYWHLYRTDVPILPRHIFEAKDHGPRGEDHSGSPDGSGHGEGVEPDGAHEGADGDDGAGADGSPAAEEPEAAPAGLPGPDPGRLAGTGPFIFVDVTPEGGYRLRRNDDYRPPSAQAAAPEGEEDEADGEYTAPGDGHGERPEPEQEEGDGEGDGGGEDHGSPGIQEARALREHARTG